MDTLLRQIQSVESKSKKSQFKDAFTQACKSGNTDEVKALLQVENACNILGGVLYLGFSKAVDRNDVALVKAMVDFPSVKIRLSAGGSFRTALIDASKSNAVDVVRFLLTEPQIKDEFSIHAFNDMALKEACRMGALEAVQFLTCSSEIQDRAAIASQDYSPLWVACNGGKMTVVQFLLTSPLIVPPNHIKVSHKVRCLPELFQGPCYDFCRAWFESRELHRELEGQARQDIVRMSPSIII